jgi:hypothetical protein
VMTYGELDENTFVQLAQRRIQIRFVTNKDRRRYCYKLS